MPRLTAKQKRRLQLTGNLVRMYVASITFVFFILCVLLANAHYRAIEEAQGVPEIPRAATYGTITGIYLPLFAAVAAYVWATRPTVEQPLAPHGFGMALFRDAFTVVVVTTVLYVPVHLYALSSTTLQWVHPMMVWYQTIITAGAGAAFTYYFHASLAPAAAKKPEAEPEAAARAGV